ncbi:MAG: preprotein translocase subunit SecY [Kiritimatiellae bacterium]|nr:preprotein translocase subunit SecY [Kiritimatiellia bacterium]
MLKAFANTLKVPELKKRILFTAGLVAICRLVSLVPTPGVDGSAISEAFKNATGTAGGLLGMMDIFTGGALARCSVGFFGIWPYISASIILQLMTAIVPALERMARDGEAGRQRLNQWTRYFTIVICVFQSFVLARTLEYHPEAVFRGISVNVVHAPGFGFEIMTVIAMTTAAMFVMWLGDQITARGIGNGISLIIMINICSRLPMAIMQAQAKYFPDMVPNQDAFQLVLLLVVGFIVCAGTVMLTQGVRKVQIHSARRSAGASAYGGMASYMPLRVNFSGVMPIIFAGPIIQIPSALLARITHPGLQWLANIGRAFSEGRSAPYMLLYAVLILFFSFFWVATQFNAVRIADDLKRTGGYVPGVRPGRATAEFLDHTMSRVTFIGAIGLIIVAIFPTILYSGMQVPWEMASFFGGTSLLIIVGVALDTLRQMESYLTMRHYDGFLKHGRIQSRRN